MLLANDKKVPVLMGFRACGDKELMRELNHQLIIKVFVEDKTLDSKKYTSIVVRHEKLKIAEDVKQQEKVVFVKRGQYSTDCWQRRPISKSGHPINPERWRHLSYWKPSVIC